MVLIMVLDSYGFTIPISGDLLSLPDLDSLNLVYLYFIIGFVQISQFSNLADMGGEK
jgi:hypothetical protein